MKIRFRDFRRTLVGRIPSAGLALLLTAAATASADVPADFREAPTDQAPNLSLHGGDSGHLPPTRKNVELVSRLEPLSQGRVSQDQIGDLAVHKGFAYLQSGSGCQPGKGGFYVVDIRSPENPRELNFIPALPGSSHGEGAQVISVDTPAFRGELLAVNNEACPGAAGGGSGGFDLYDVSNPANPVALVRGIGDTGGEGALAGSAPRAHSTRSISVWDAGEKAYAVTADAEETHDVDIFEITNPRSPQTVREYNLFDTARSAFTDDANAFTSTHRDTVVKRIGGRFKLLVGYHDAGYIQLDAQDPADLRYEGDSDFGGTDPLTGFNPPEGNAHYAEYSSDNRFLLTAEEDLAPSRVQHIDIGNAGRRAAAMVPGGASPGLLGDGRMNGSVAYVGYACNDSAAVPTPEQIGMPARAEGEDWIAVAQRGPAFDPDEDYDGDGSVDNDSDDACFPGEKAQNAANAGWDAVLIVNRHTRTSQGTDAGSAGDGVNCGAGGFPAGEQIVTVCTTHAAFHELFNDEIGYTTPYDDSDVPAAGDHPLPHEGPNLEDHGPNKVSAEGRFDGWGYMSLYETVPNANGKFPLLDAHAIKEALNPAYAFGFGELSIHEQAADPTQPLTYSSYRSGGLRVFSFEAAKITEQGAFIDAGGNDLWGIEQFTSGDGERLIAASDRDFGLFIFRYTGPLAAPRDADLDGVGDPSDNCAAAANPDQANSDRDSVGGDACDPDDDNDGVSDANEGAYGTSRLDLDSDDDGLSDATENRDRDGRRDSGELHAKRFDSDTDALGDGQERGLRSGVVDPSGPVKGTDTQKFKRDIHPATKTNPLRADTDADRLKDGSEDRNRNGRRESTETDPLKRDTDGDGRIDGSDPRPLRRS